MKPTQVFRILALVWLALPGLAQSSYEPYSFTTLAGPGGSLDGTGSAARFYYPRGVAADIAGNVYVADSDNNTIRKVTPTGMVTTLAGSGRLNGGSVDGTGSAAEFWGPSGVAVDGAGNVYVTDFFNNTIRKVTSAGVVTTLAGLAGNEGSADGIGRSARFHFYYVSGVAVDSTGNVYVADSVNFTIRKVTAGAVTTLAGQAGSQGTRDGTGSTARFQFPSGVAVDNAGNIYVTDIGMVRKVTSSGVVTTLAGRAGTFGSADGTGSAAEFLGPSGVAVDNAGNIYVADTENHTIRKVTPTGVVTTLAGLAQVQTNGFNVGGYADGGGSAARFARPQGVAVDGGGNVYVADVNNSVIRKVTAEGAVTTLAGMAGGILAADGNGTLARFSQPQALVVDSERNVYVADSGNNTIRKVTSTGMVTTFAGLAGNQGSADGTGSEARFNRPQGVALDSAGNIYVADTYNFTIRKVTPVGVVTTLAGLAGSDGSADGRRNEARFGRDPWDGAGPQCLAVDRADNIYVGDAGNSTIRKVTPAGEVTTLAGSAGITGSEDGTGSAARFNTPVGVAVDSAGNVYVADSGNMYSFNWTIRKVTPEGVVTTLAGLAGIPGSEDGTGSAARFRDPAGMAVDGAGNVYIADMGNNTVRKITPAGIVTTLAGFAGSPGNSDGMGGEALFNSPAGVAVDLGGIIYVADAGNSTIRKGIPALFILRSGFDGARFELTVSGPIGSSATLETSMDLVNWLPLGTGGTFWTNPIYLSDPDASNFPRRFYRVISPRP